MFDLDVLFISFSYVFLNLSLLYILVKVKAQILTCSPSYVKALPFQRIAITFAINMLLISNQCIKASFLYVFILLLLLFLTVYYMTFVTSSVWYLTFFPLCCSSDIYLSPVNSYILYLPKETAMPCSDTLSRTLDPLLE